MMTKRELEWCIEYTRDLLRENPDKETQKKLEEDIKQYEALLKAIGEDDKTKEKIEAMNNSCKFSVFIF